MVAECCSSQGTDRGVGIQAASFLRGSSKAPKQFLLAPVRGACVGAPNLEPQLEAGGKFKLPLVDSVGLLGGNLSLCLISCEVNPTFKFFSSSPTALNKVNLYWFRVLAESPNITVLLKPFY
eukprot:scaffold91615_cov16-Tisochrysis_lutea.AAC.1